MMVALPTTCQFLQRDLPLEFRHSAGIVKSARGISPESCLKCTGETCTCTLTGKTCGELQTFCTHLENGYLLNSMEMATTMPCTTSRTTRLIKLYAVRAHCTGQAVSAHSICSPEKLRIAYRCTLCNSFESKSSFRSILVSHPYHLIGFLCNLVLRVLFLHPLCLEGGRESTLGTT